MDQTNTRCEGCDKEVGEYEPEFFQCYHCDAMLCAMCHKAHNESRRCAD